MSVILLWAGIIVYLAAGLLLMVRAFKVSASWGIAVLLIPGAALVFIIKDWQDSKNYFYAILGGMACIVVAAITIQATPTDASTVAASSDAPREEPQVQEQVNYASAAPSTPVSYDPPRTTYTPPAQRPATQTVAEEPVAEWERKTTTEQVFADRDTKTYHAVSCGKKPANGYRIAKSVAKMQGFTETKCP